jgi:hypothetical protein
VDEIYLFPTCVALVVAALIVLWARRRQHGWLASGITGGVAGLVAWYATLLATVVMMIPAGAHG